MKKIFTSLALLAASAAHSQIATHIVISEVYGGGGGGSSTFKNDFIELYNPTSCPVSLAGWSVQYAPATTANWQVTNLSGTIPAKGFYLIGEAAGNTVGSNLPTPDANGTIAMAAGAGKVALVATTSQLSGCPTAAQVVDLVGYGTTANCYEGSGPTPAPSATASVERKASATSTATTLATGGTDVAMGNGYDANVNSTDFVVQSGTNINPQNSTIIEGTVSNTASVTAGISPAEPATNGTFIVSLSAPAPAGGITVAYTLGGTATAGTDYTDVQGGSITIPQGNATGTINLSIIDDLTAEGSETIIITLTAVNGGYAVCGNATLSIADNDFAITLLHTIQGAGSTATAGTFTAEAIVTDVYPSLSPAGFYMQEEDADADANANTSEGIFVVSSATVAVGDKVQVTGTVQESPAAPSFDQAVFTSAMVNVINHSNTLPTLTNITLPVSAATDFEKYEGMLVRFPATLTVTNNYNLGRYGEVGLSSGGLVYQPTQVIDPNDATASGTSSSGTSNVAAINALVASNGLRTILLDDGFNSTVTLPYADAIDNTLRIGSTIANLSGIMGYAFSTYRIQPITTYPISFTYAARPAVPSVGISNVKLASFNVLNYFNGDGLGGGFPTTRGANSLAEFNRQRTKIISAISQMNADVVGLTEIENDGTGTTSAIQDLVNGLNAVMGAGTYSIINDGASTQTNSSDEIRCGIIYKSSVVTPNGSAMLSPAAIFNRPPVSQTFTVQATNVNFNFIINHFKSKGCTSSTGADQDQFDGQSCYNDRRKSQASALLSFISTTVIPASGTSRVISVGDYNSYEEEDPLDIFRAASYTVLGGSNLYSYQFDGQIGSLDHAFVSSSLSNYVTGFAKWNINAAEPVYLDYNDAVNDGGSDIVNPFASTYTTSAYRSSDHDPVLIGLGLPVSLPIKITAFDAAKRNGMAVINWTTASEASVREFIIERATKQGEWHAIGQATPSNYSYGSKYAVTDANPVSGDNLYRLRTVDVDGSFSLSSIKKVTFERAEAGYYIYPNPATNALHITTGVGMAAGASIQIMNTMNQPALPSQPVAQLPTQIDISALAPGIYFIRILSDNGSTITTRFMKQ